MAIQLAQAYVAIVPSMKGVGQAISKAFGDASKSAGESSGASGGKGFSSGLLKQGAIIGAASQIASKAFDVIKNSISGAVSRVDTMKNFGLTMQNLGYKSSDASKAIKLMSDRLIGLPTSLDAMAGMVQQLAPVTGSIKTATNLSLAFNDALLAGGKSTMAQENALQQYTQMLANGKPDLQSWRSMQDAMPGQLNQVAKALLGTKANSMTLYKAMQDGTVTFDQFNGKLVELDSKGTQGFASFSKQAKDATGGIGTAWTNVQTAITRALANIIAAIGSGGIANAINSFGSTISAVGNSLSEFVGWVKQNVTWLGPLASAIAAGYTAFMLWRGISGVIMTTKAALTAFKAAQGASTVAQALLNAVMAANPIMLVVVALAAVTAALVYFFTQTKTGQAIWSAFMSWLRSAWSSVSGFFSGLWSGIVGFFRGAASGAKSVWSAVTSWFASIPGRIVGFFSSLGSRISSLFSSAASGVKNVWNGVVNWFSGLPGRILSAIGNVGSLLWNAGSSIINGFLNGLKSAWGNVTGFVGGIAGWIKDHKGPISYDAKLLIPAGNVIMQGFGDSLQKSFRMNVVPFVSGVNGQLQDIVGSTGVNAQMGANASRYSATFTGSGTVTGSNGVIQNINITNKGVVNPYVNGNILGRTAASSARASLMGV